MLCGKKIPRQGTFCVTIYKCRSSAYKWRQHTHHTRPSNVAEIKGDAALKQHHDKSRSFIHHSAGSLHVHFYKKCSKVAVRWHVISFECYFLLDLVLIGVSFGEGTADRFPGAGKGRAGIVVPGEIPSTTPQLQSIHYAGER